MIKAKSFSGFKDKRNEQKFKEKRSRTEKAEKISSHDEPIPKPPPQYWNDPLSYRRFNRESEGTSYIL